MFLLPLLLLFLLSYYSSSALHKHFLRCGISKWYHASFFPQYVHWIHGQCDVYEKNERQIAMSTSRQKADEGFPHGCSRTVHIILMRHETTRSVSQDKLCYLFLFSQTFVQPCWSQFAVKIPLKGFFSSACVVRVTQEHVFAKSTMDCKAEGYSSECHQSKA